jgi:hypothetical protein
MKEPQARGNLGPFRSHPSGCSAYCEVPGLEAGVLPPMLPM